MQRNGPPFDSSAARQQLTEIKEALLVLHKALIESERIEYERTFGAIESPNAFLKLLMDDPWFAWLRPVSMVVVAIDEALDSDEPLQLSAVQQLRTRASRLLKASEEGQGFERAYFEALQRTPEVILAHAAAKESLKA